MDETTDPTTTGTSATGGPATAGSPNVNGPGALDEPEVMPATPPASRVPEWLSAWVASIEANPVFDRIGDRMMPLARRLDDGTAGPALRGEWLGHALHPLMTDLPLGCWLSAGLLDVVGGRSGRRSAQRLVGLGLCFVPLTAASGMTDWSAIERTGTRRAGVAHAVGNTAAALAYFRSWRNRRRGRHLRGMFWGMTGGSIAVATGYLGGHLGFARRVGTGERGDLPVDRSDGNGVNGPLSKYEEVVAARVVVG